MTEKSLRELLERSERKLAALHEELTAIGDGRLNIRKKDGTWYFVERVNGTRKGIKKDEARVKDLARKAWLEEKIKVVDAEVEVLRDACERFKFIENGGIMRVSDWLTTAGLAGFDYSDMELEWLQNRQSKNPYMSESLKYKTGGGVLVRSKSERFIGDFLEKKKVVYAYEQEIEVDNKMMYPDFMILCPSGRVVIWEHCGLMDRVDYFSRTMARINEYRKIGYTQHDNLICTYEEDLDSVEVLERIYGKYIF